MRSRQSTTTPSQLVSMSRGVGSVSTPSRVTTSTRTIAILAPNDNTVGSDWRPFRVSVNQVESLTGYDFFSNVPVSIQSVIESSVDNQLVEDWEAMTPDKAAMEENKASSSGDSKDKR